ncbi:MAG: transposase, partial [Paludibacteraceae bacterium]|nr:transposase [Paludibacteraceae bacterium]
GRSKYLLSLPVQICVSDESPVDARIVCVRNRNNRKDWIALITTDVKLSEEDIIRIYGKRWDIEVFFKVCKSALLLTKGYHGLSYDALTAHVSIVFARYMLLAVAKRENEDERTLGELFCLMVSEVADLSFQESMLLIVSAMMDAVKDMFRLTDTQVDVLLERFLGKLPEHLRRSLQPRLAA